MRIGLYGGTFDPPHTGHLIVAQDALVQLGLERLTFIPAASPPHKRDRAVTPARIRLAMLEAAVGADDRFAVDDLELRREGPSYTVDTLLDYRAANPQAELFLVLGADQYAELDSWMRADEVRRLARLAVMRRGGQGPAVSDADVIALRVTRIDISASEIRRRVCEGLPIRYLVHPEVVALIEKYGLYRAPHATA